MGLATAVHAQADYLITRNRKDFPRQPLPVLEPLEFLVVVKRELAVYEGSPCRNGSVVKRYSWSAGLGFGLGKRDVGGNTGAIAWAGTQV